MSTILFDRTIFGPVRSRRLGISLGVNLLPVDSKFCNFNCIYCECGWTGRGLHPVLPPRSLVRSELEARLMAMHRAGEPLDAITFAGNGEPTIHPDFPGIIDDTLLLRKALYPEARIVVLSNATMLGHGPVREALRRVDQAALKLDSAIDSTLQLIDNPRRSLRVEEVVSSLLDFGHDYTLQTMFLRGSFQGRPVDNTTEVELKAWLEVVRQLRPREVMVYTIDRETPTPTLEKVPLEELQRIGRRVEALGIPAQVRG